MHQPGGPEIEILSIAVGGLTRTELRAALRSRGVMLNAHAETLLDHPVFDVCDPLEILVTERSVEELGLADGATLPVVFATAQEQGLRLCPPDAGPYVRLAMMEQANAPDSVLSGGHSPAGAIKVAAAPLSDDVDFPKGFYLRVVDGQHWLRGFRCDDEYLFGPADRFLFQLSAA